MTTLNAEVIDAMMWRAGQTRNWAWDNKWPANVREFFDADVPAIFAEITRLQAESAKHDPAKVAEWIAERDELAGQVATVEQENDRLRKRLETAQREADTWWKRSETQVDIIADVRAENERLLTKADNLRLAYELKVADLAVETERVGILAKVLMDDNHSPDGFHAQGDRCRHCAALREALRPVGAVTS